MKCAEWARREQVDPVGTAASAAGWLLVDWPLPWPRAAEDVPALAPVRAALAGTGIRLQLVVPDAAIDERRVALYHRRGADGWFEGCDRQVLEVAPGDVVEAALAMHTAEGGAPTHEVDVLVCAHGARDRCCGSLGTSLAVKPVPGVEIRRTSHLGGHRFAPTGMLLPDATSWAFLDPDAIRRIVTRSGPLDDLLPRYRGCAALGSPAAQALDRAAFGKVGWTWLGYARRAVDIGPGAVRMEARSPTGEIVTWDAPVAAGRTLPVPECGRELGEARKSETEVVLGEMRRVRVARRTATARPGRME